MGCSGDVTDAVFLRELFETLVKVGPVSVTTVSGSPACVEKMLLSVSVVTEAVMFPATLNVSPPAPRTRDSLLTDSASHDMARHCHQNKSPSKRKEKHRTLH